MFVQNRAVADIYHHWNKENYTQEMFSETLLQMGNVSHYDSRRLIEIMGVRIVNQIVTL